MSDYQWLMEWIAREGGNWSLHITPRRVLTATTFYTAEIVEVYVKVSLVEDPAIRLTLIAIAESSNAEDALTHLREKIERGERLDKPGRVKPRKAMDWDEFPEIFQKPLFPSPHGAPAMPTYNATHFALAVSLLVYDPSLPITPGETVELAVRVAGRVPATSEDVLRDGLLSVREGMPLENVINAWRLIVGDPVLR